MKPRQHFTCIEVMPTFIFAMKPYLHRSRANAHLCHEATTTLHISTCTYIGIAPIFRGNVAQTSRMHSTVARHQDFGDANKTLKMQGVANKILKMQGVANKILKMQGNANKTLKFQEECCQDFDIARSSY